MKFGHVENSSVTRKKNTVVTGSGSTLLDWSAQENPHRFSTAGKATAARDTATGGETQKLK